jgi:hypothetical protein
MSYAPYPTSETSRFSMQASTSAPGRQAIRLRFASQAVSPPPAGPNPLLGPPSPSSLAVAAPTLIIIIIYLVPPVLPLSFLPYYLYYLF